MINVHPKLAISLNCVHNIRYVGKISAILGTLVKYHEYW